MAANQESTLMRTAACPGDASTDSNTPRTELKAFQKAFQNKHNRAPTKGEITGNPAIALLYKRYQESKTIIKPSPVSADATARPQLFETTLFKQQADKQLHVEEARPAEKETSAANAAPIIHRVPNEIWLFFVIPELGFPSLVCFARSHPKFRRLSNVRQQREGGPVVKKKHKRKRRRRRSSESESGSEEEEILEDKDRVWKERAQQYGFTKSLEYSYSSWFSLCCALVDHGWPAQCRVCSSLFKKQMQINLSQSMDLPIDINENLRYPNENLAADYQVIRRTRDRPTVSEAHWDSYIHNGEVTMGIHLREHVVLSSLIPTTRPVKSLHCHLVDPEVPGQVTDGRGYARLRETKVQNPSGISTLDLMDAGATWHADLPPGARFRNKADFMGLELQGDTVLFCWERHYGESEDSEDSASEDSDAWDALTDVEEYERRRQDHRRRVHAEREREERGYVESYGEVRKPYTFRPY